jgi:hypothetical protein
MPPAVPKALGMATVWLCHRAGARAPAFVDRRIILLFDDRDSSGTSSLPDLIRQSVPPIRSRGLDARVKHGHDMGSDQCNLVLPD